MSINIAFNTIIYIMVFLFPGILFRRAFFSGKFTKHFDSGNNFERLLWNILFSIISIALFCIAIVMIENYTRTNFNKIFGITPQEILNNFILIYENKFPIILNDSVSFLSVFYVLTSLYCLSGIIGIFVHKLVFILGLEKRYSIFKFQNSWDYLTNSNKQNNVNHKLGDIHYTKADIKTIDDELFTGKLHEIIFDKDGKIEAFAIQDSYKFCVLDIINDCTKISDVRNSISPNNPNILFHFETSTKFHYKKRIKGNILTVFNDRVQNISFTYIKISHVFKKFQKYLKYIVSVLLLVITAFSISYAIWDFDLIKFESLYQRVGFCIMTPIASCLLILFLITIFDFAKYRISSKKYFLDLKDGILHLAYFFIPYLYVFNYIKFYTMIVVLVFFLIPLGLLVSSKK